MFVATVVPCRRLSTSASATPAFAQSAADALDDAARRVVRGRRDLVDGDPARLLVDEDQVGERAADVDADRASCRDLLRAPGRSPRPTSSICSSLAVQVRGRDLVDPQLGQLADPLQAPLRRPGDREVVDELAGQVARCARPTSRGGPRSSRSRSRAATSRVISSGMPWSRVPLQRVRDVVRAGGRRPAALAPRPPPGRRRPTSRRARRSRPRPGSRPASSAPARTCSIAQRTDAGLTPT